jgi:hypothetical protein
VAASNGWSRPTPAVPSHSERWARCFPISAVAYLDAAARYGAATRVGEVLDAWGSSFEAAISRARAMSIRARANRDSKALLEAAEFHATAGLNGDALGLAELAVAGFGSDRSGDLTRAKSLAREMRLRLERPEGALGPVVPLTRRDMEVAALAAKGMSDRDISEVLFLWCERCRTISPRSIASWPSRPGEACVTRSTNRARCEEAGRSGVARAAGRCMPSSRCTSPPLQTAVRRRSCA